ncbi:hypothetical protein E2C01_020167 [Portunus trituberculatus]|uniref:Uncharacterized protein n=1 Tax=Portunus trituberculatus TaxID=210409 RepID=A0A5B7E1D9_PORTR|nr:hypothetical protein [Portunus trituberculatus]
MFSPYTVNWPVSAPAPRGQQLLGSVLLSLPHQGAQVPAAVRLVIPAVPGSVLVAQTGQRVAPPGSPSAK